MKVLNILLIIFGVMKTNISHAETVWQGSAILIVKPEKLKEFKRAVSKIIEPTRKEASCISYYGYQIIDEHGKATNRFEFHEIWKSKEAMLIEHKEKSEHMRNFFNEIKANAADSFLDSFEVKGQSVQIIN